jgi:hypothetical protein
VRVGDKRVYEVRHAGGWTTEESEVVTKVEQKDGAKVVTVRTEWGTSASDSVYQVSARGVFRLSVAGSEEKPPLCFLKLPYQPGGTWEKHYPDQWDLKGVCTAFGTERVEVPAGVFQAVRVDVRYVHELIEGEKVMYHWYEPRIGMVKETWGDNHRVLKYFTPGKD